MVMVLTDHSSCISELILEVRENREMRTYFRDLFS
jgi:hypothetical protein